MNTFERVKILADIAKISSEIYGLIVDKSRAVARDKARITALEEEVSALKARLG